MTQISTGIATRPVKTKVQVLPELATLVEIFWRQSWKDAIPSYQCVHLGVLISPYTEGHLRKGIVEFLVVLAKNYSNNNRRDNSIGSEP